MKDKANIFSITAVLLLLLLPGLSFTSPITYSADFVPGEVIVTVAGNQSTLQKNAAGRTLREMKKISKNRFLVTLSKSQSVAEAIRSLSQQPGIIHVQPNYVYRPCLVPTDPYYSEQWALKNDGQTILGTTGTAGADIAAEGAWDITTGSPDVIVAVIDTGVAYDHPDLSPSIWQNPNETPDNGVDDDDNGYIDDVIGWDFEDSDNDPWDPNGHGTHVAGIIGAKMNNGIGITGISPNVRIMPLKAGGINGYFTTATLIQAIDYAVNMNARVINASWGGTSYDQDLKDAISGAGKNGVLVVAAAGNNSSNNDNAPFYPASFELGNIISVASSDQNDELASFSNYGVSSVDVAAPGVGILSAFTASETIFFDDFETGALNGWITGGSGNTWGIESGNAYNGSSYSLSDSPGGNYASDLYSYASRPVDLTGRKGAVLTGYVTGTSSPEDKLYVQSSEDGVSWFTEKIEITNGNSYLQDYFSDDMSYAWFQFRVDLGNLDGNNGFFRFLFITDSDNQTVDDGWYLDNLTISAGVTPSENTFYYMSGTSMSAPLVSGIAALLLSERPELSPEELKTLIVMSCDPANSLSDKVACGGRVDAYKALTSNLPPPPGGGGGCNLHPGDRKPGIAVLTIILLALPFIIFKRYTSNRE